MFSTTDTIVAIATPPGRGGIGVVRLSGSAVRAISRSLLGLTDDLRPRHATFGRVRGDQVVATYFPAPHSYTGEDVVEISAHGSPVVLRQIVEDAMTAGARLAEPGEYTLRAFLHGRMDLIQAEAVADLIDAVTPLQARAAFDQLEGTLTSRIGAIDAALFDLIARIEASLDFPDEGYHFVEPSQIAAELRSLQGNVSSLLCEARRGRLIREGAQVAIVGKPNVGKSSLFNALVGVERAIVTAHPGTTRDLVSEKAEVEGLDLLLIDTAGIREAIDEVELEGVTRAKRTWATADLVLVVLDGSCALEAADLDVLRQTSERLRVIVTNKADVAAAWRDLPSGERALPVSATTGAGVDGLRKLLRSRLEAFDGVSRDTAAVTNVRHAALLEKTLASLQRAWDSVERVDGPLPEEFVLTDLFEAKNALEEVTGKRAPDDLLAHIFSRFCIGK